MKIQWGTQSRSRRVGPLTPTIEKEDSKKQTGLGAAQSKEQAEERVGFCSNNKNDAVYLSMEVLTAIQKRDNSRVLSYPAENPTVLFFEPAESINVTT